MGREGRWVGEERPGSVVQLMFEGVLRCKQRPGAQIAVARCLPWSAAPVYHTPCILPSPARPS
eukprot:12266590-Alexandrium_andersonii.AAC.1